MFVKEPLWNLDHLRILSIPEFCLILHIWCKKLRRVWICNQDFVIGSYSRVIGDFSDKLTDFLKIFSKNYRKSPIITYYLRLSDKWNCLLLVDRFLLGAWCFPKRLFVISVLKKSSIWALLLIRCLIAFDNEEVSSNTHTKKTRTLTCAISVHVH